MDLLCSNSCWAAGTCPTHGSGLSCTGGPADRQDPQIKSRQGRECGAGVGGKTIVLIFRSDLPQFSPFSGEVMEELCVQLDDSSIKNFFSKVWPFPPQNRAHLSNGV
jgi:hypothetical protein